MTHGQELLRVEGLEKRFGGVLALSEYGITIQQHELVGLIGPNGAGKTTIFNLLSGILKPTAGKIYFSDQDVAGKRPDQTTNLGIVRTFQNIRLFNELSVLDNVKAAFHARMGSGVAKTFLRPRAFRRSERAIHAEATRLLELTGLTKLADLAAKNLPYGHQRKVEIARALATHPRLLLLDEPAAGLNPQETTELVDLIKRVHAEFGLTTFLVEHDMVVVMENCDRVQVLVYGKVLTEGSPEEVRRDPRVIDAYLGTGTGQ